MRRIYAEMRTSMSKNEEQLVKLVKDVISGASDKEQFCKDFFNEVYALVYPVFGTENSRKITNKALIYICGNIDKINTDKNIHRQIATEVSVFMFGLIDTRTIKKAGIDTSYEYNRIKEDEQLYELIKNNVRIFRNTKAYDDADESIQDLSRVQTILLELYGYEMHSVQEISDMLNVEDTFVSGMLARTKAALFGINLEDSEDVQPEDEQETEEEHNTEEEQITDEEAYFVDDDIDFDDRSDENPFRKRTKQEEADAIRRSDAANPVVKALAGVIGKLFPDLSQTARRIVVYVAGGVVMFAIVLSIFLSVILSTSFTSAKRNNAGNFKITMAETSSSKENATKEKTTKKSKTDTGNDNNAGNNDNNNSNNSNRNNSDNRKDNDKEEESEEEEEETEETEEATQEETTAEESSQKETETVTKDSDNKAEETSSTDKNGGDDSQSTEATNATEESTTKAATTDTKADTNNGGAGNGTDSVKENGGNKLN